MSLPKYYEKPLHYEPKKKKQCSLIYFLVHNVKEIKARKTNWSSRVVRIDILIAISARYENKIAINVIEPLTEITS